MGINDAFLELSVIRYNIVRIIKLTTGGEKVRSVINKNEIKSRCNLVDAARTLGIEMQRNGDTFAIRCPWHFGGRYDHHIGNCYIDKRHKYFVCKSCGNSGDVLTLIQQVKNCSFTDALQWLSEYTGVEIIYADEGKQYIDSYGNLRTAHRIITHDEQKFLGIYDDPVFFTDDLFTDYKQAKDSLAMPVPGKNGHDLWRKKEMAEPNPLSKFASDDHLRYCELIKHFISVKYDKLMERLSLWEKAPYYSYIYSETVDDILRLRDICIDVDGDPMKLKIPKKVEKISFSVDLSAVPF